MESTINALGSLGPIGIALIVLLILWVLMGRTNKRYIDEIQALRDARDKELARVNLDHDTELAELRAEIRSLRDEIKSLRTEMEEERIARRLAEEEAHWLKLGRDNG